MIHRMNNIPWWVFLAVGITLIILGIALRVPQPAPKVPPADTMGAYYIVARDVLEGPYTGPVRNIGYNAGRSIETKGKEG